VHQDAPDGKKIGMVDFNGVSGTDQTISHQPYRQILTIPLDAAKYDGKHTLYITSKTKAAPAGTAQLALWTIRFATSPG
jgi:hypothetical protein